MGFSPLIVGLGQFPIVHPFLERRRDCFHAGIDIGSGGVERKFRAGIFGRVARTGGRCNTITVVPFQAATETVQYLHCSRFLVKEGDVVAPWTQIGVTGNVGCGSRGIHLHLQVVKLRGRPRKHCWSRNYVDPTRWRIQDLMVGNWSVNSVGRHWNTEINIEISRSATGGLVGVYKTANTNIDNCFRIHTYQWNGKIARRVGNKLVVTAPRGRAVVECCRDSDCGRCNANPLSLDLTLIGPDELKSSNGYQFKRTSNLASSELRMAEQDEPQDGVLYEELFERPADLFPLDVILAENPTALDADASVT